MCLNNSESWNTWSSNSNNHHSNNINNANIHKLNKKSLCMFRHLFIMLKHRSQLDCLLRCDATNHSSESVIISQSLETVCALIEYTT